MLMGKKSRTISYETIVQLLVLAIAAVTPYLAINLMDYEVFSVSKSMFITLWSSINPWLYPPYVYLLINFMIFIIFALSIIHSNTIFHNPSNDHDHDSFTESSLDSQNLVVGSTLLDDECKFHTLDDTFKDRDYDDNMNVHTSKDTFKGRVQDDNIKVHTSADTFKDHVNMKVHASADTLKGHDHDDSMKVDTLEDTFKDWEGHVKIHKLQSKSIKKSKEVVPESVVDKRELRKSRTFHEGGSMHRSRVERYVKILSHEELDRQVEAFIHKFKNK